MHNLTTNFQFEGKSFLTKTFTKTTTILTKLILIFLIGTNFSWGQSTTNCSDQQGLVGSGTVEYVFGELKVLLGVPFQSTNMVQICKGQYLSMDIILEAPIISNESTYYQVSMDILHGICADNPPYPLRLAQTRGCSESLRPRYECGPIVRFNQNAPYTPHLSR